MQKLVLILVGFMASMYERVQVLVAAQQPNVTGLDNQVTQRGIERGTRDDQVRRYLTPGLLSQVLEESKEPIDVEAAAAIAPLLFTVTPQFENWLSTVIWVSKPLL